MSLTQTQLMGCWQPGLLHIVAYQFDCNFLLLVVTLTYSTNSLLMLMLTVR